MSNIINVRPEAENVTIGCCSSEQERLTRLAVDDNALAEFMPESWMRAALSTSRVNLHAALEPVPEAARRLPRQLAGFGAFDALDPLLANVLRSSIRRCTLSIIFDGKSRTNRNLGKCHHQSPPPSHTGPIFQLETPLYAHARGLVSSCNLVAIYVQGVNTGIFGNYIIDSVSSSISLERGTGSVVGGTTLESRNYIQGSRGTSIEVLTANSVVVNNFIGLRDDLSGMVDA